MGIVQVSEKKGYKVLKWVMLVLGVICLGGGGVMLLSGLGGGGSSFSPQKIHFTAPGLVAHEDMNYYSMEVFKKHTSIMVNTSPWGSSRRVNFEILQGEEYLTITPSIWPGELAVMTLVGDANNPYQFGKTVIISVKSGQEHEFLHVMIVLPPDQVSFQFELKNESTGWPITEISAETYYKDVYSNYPISIEAASKFQFNARLNVFGGLVAGTQFRASPQGTDYHIRLFGVSENDPNPSGLQPGQIFRNIYIPVEVIRQVKDSDNPNAYRTFRFMISSEYLGQHIGFFELRIIR